MGKFIVRITVIFVALYFLTAYMIALFFCEDVLYNSYTLLFELCVVVYTFSEGKYHCKYIKWTALSILFVDVLSHFDYYLDFISVEYYNAIMVSILFSGICMSTYKAFSHFSKVRKTLRDNGKHKIR